MRFRGQGSEEGHCFNVELVEKRHDQVIFTFTWKVLWHLEQKIQEERKYLH